jgi:cation diffusion facilitator family transporter
MFSEFFQGIADLTSTGFLLIGYKSSNKKPDKLHPFGHGKEIYFWTLISAVVTMTLASSASIYVGLHRLTHPQEISNIILGYLVLLIGLSTNGYALSLSFKRLMEGKPFRMLSKIFLDSNAVATKNAFILDLMGTVAAGNGLISLGLYQLTGQSRFDAFGAIVIGVVTAILALILIYGVKGFLVGKRATPDIEKKIRQVTLQTPQVKEVLDLRTMQIGSEKLLVNMEVHMQDMLTTDELEKLIDEIKAHVRREVPSIQHVQVELETPEK